MNKDLHAWDAVNDAINFGMERYIERVGSWLRLYDEVFYPITGIHPDDAEADRQNRMEDIVALHIIDRSLPAKSLDFYTMNAARKRLINAGVLQKKSRGGWKINRKLDPRR